MTHSIGGWRDSLPAPRSSSGFDLGAPSVAAYIDLSTLPAELRAERLAVLARPDMLGRIVSRAIVYGISPSETLPTGWAAAGDVLAGQACGWAFDVAAESALPVLIVMAGALPAAESISALLDALTIDPLFGLALPRLSGSDGRLHLSRPFHQDDASGPLRLLAALPSFQIRSESVAPCMLIRRELVGNLHFENEQPVWTGLADYAIRARRMGFRPVMCNRVVVPLDDAEENVWGCQASEIERLRQRYAETGPRRFGVRAAPNGCSRRRSIVRTPCSSMPGT